MHKINNKRNTYACIHTHTYLQCPKQFNTCRNFAPKISCYNQELLSRNELTWKKKSKSDSNLRTLRIYHNRSRCQIVAL